MSTSPYRPIGLGALNPRPKGRGTSRIFVAARPASGVEEDIGPDHLSRALLGTIRSRRAKASLAQGEAETLPTITDRCGMSRRDQCRCKTDDMVDGVEEMRLVAAVLVDDPKPVRLEVVDDAKPITLEVVEETAFVTVDVVEEVKPAPPLSATGATPVGVAAVKNRWNGPLSPGGSPLG